VGVAAGVVGIGARGAPRIARGRPAFQRPGDARVADNAAMPAPSKSRTRANTPAFTSALGQPLADKRVEILRRIAASGSISQAGREVGVSYKAAWQAIDTLTNLAGVALVERVVGGAGGGGARITEAGRQLLIAADALEQARARVLRGFEGRAAEGRTLERLAIRTSMRNQWPCVVVALDAQGLAVDVRLALDDGTRLDSRITRESAELLGLQAGLPVLALCKATAVRVAREGTTEPVDAVNTLAARVRRVSRGPAGDEVVAEVGAGLQLVGFTAAASGLRAGSRVRMQVEASAVVIALAG